MMESNEARKELDIFKELENLCLSPGYIHAIAYFCYRDNHIRYADEVKTEDVLTQYSMERLIRTEISTLIGLACKKNIDEMLPSSDILENYITKTESLLKELHDSMMPHLDLSKLRDDDFNPFNSGSVLRESIFYVIND